MKDRKKHARAREEFITEARRAVRNAEETWPRWKLAYRLNDYSTADIRVTPRGQASLRESTKE